MIAYLSGKLAHAEPSHVIIECNGIGYLVKISLNTFSKIQGKETVKLHTYFHVREDAQVLYGFSDPKEQTIFEQLISINGVGTNTAIVILSSISPDELFSAVRNEDVAALKRIKGIGAKTAGRIILELKDKIKMEGVSASVGADLISRATRKQEALSALISLGLPRATMGKRIDEIIKEKGGDVSVEEIVKLALRNP